MVYSAQMKKAVGALRSCLADAGLGCQDERFREHGSHQPDPQAPLILVACSGGRDSLALAAVSSLVSATWGLRCGAVLIDHGLVSGSDQVSKRAAHECKQLGLDPILIRHVRVSQTKAGLEADARQARYRAIGLAAQDVGASAVLLAHTMDDQAETVLIGLIRTRGLDAINGMEERVTRQGLLYLRPFLGLTRSETTLICQQYGLVWWDDPTNGDGYSKDQSLPTDFPLRSRIRHDLLPRLSQFAGRDMVRHLALGAVQAREETDYLDKRAGLLAEQVVQDPNPEDLDRGIMARLNAHILSEEHPALRKRFFVRFLSDLGIQIGPDQVRGLDALVSNWHGQEGPTFSSSYSAFRKGQVILICNDRTHANR